MRLPPELRSGIVPDLLSWFMLCAGNTGESLEARDDRVGNLDRWYEVAHAVRHAAYRTPYAPIGSYMDRWWFMPELYGERARVHRTNRSDHARHFHDHPWHFVSVILEGGYSEQIEVQPGANPLYETRRYRAGDVLFRHAEHRHRLEIEPGIEAWSLVFTAPKSRDWGFWTPEGFVPWRDYEVEA